MGYKNERAVGNKYSGMKQYCEEQVFKQLVKTKSRVLAKEEVAKALKPTFVFQSDATYINKTPVLAFDGGIATIFPGEPIETKILKVASGFPEEFSSIFTAAYEDYIHIYSGQLKWPDGVNKTLAEVILESVKIILENKTILQALDYLEITTEQFEEAMVSRFNHIKGKGAEDNVREILELSGIINCTESLYKSPLVESNFKDKDLQIPYLLIKDGTLYPSKMTASSLFAEAVAGWLNSGKHFVVGVIKDSRFINAENAWSEIIKEYGQELKSHTFFKINKQVELSIDPHADSNDFSRYFLSLFGGKSMFEIQIPRVLSNDDKKVKEILNIIASQVTVQYGGSISTNSYAHANASLPENEARVLSYDLKYELEEELKKLKDKKDEKP